MLVIKLSSKLSGLSISLAGLIKVFLLRVIKVFYKSSDLFFIFRNHRSTYAYMQGYFIISRPWAKDWCLRIWAALSFPFPRFNLNILTVIDHL